MKAVRPSERAAPPLPQGEINTRKPLPKTTRDCRREALLRSRTTADFSHTRTYSAYDGAPVMLLGTTGLRVLRVPLNYGLSYSYMHHANT